MALLQTAQFPIRIRIPISGHIQLPACPRGEGDTKMRVITILKVAVMNSIILTLPLRVKIHHPGGSHPDKK